MSRYIDADTAKINLSALKKYNNSHGIILAADEEAISEWIDKQPTADVRENVRGEWKEIAERGLCDLRRCSNCGHIEAVGLEMITPKPNFCPNCGADMRSKS